MIYLYIKTHNITGLRYFGKTERDPFNYKGSGKYWKLHINKHGYDVSTEIIFQSESKEEIKEKGLYYSKLWDIVKSDQWANLKEECGDGGGILGSTKSEKTKLKISLAQKNKPRNQIFNLDGLTEARKWKKTCKFCNREFDLGNYGKYHDLKCKLNPNLDLTILEERSKHAKKAAKASVISRSKNARQ